MKEQLIKILNDTNIFDKNSIPKKINVGFTNSLFSVDDKYIIKICKNKENENKFLKEIEFYKHNENNPYIPKLYSYHVSENEKDYSYIVIEFVKGKTLYNVWHTLDEKERKEVIENIVNLMKSFHSIKGKRYDWSNYIKDKLIHNFNFCREKNIFTSSELELAEYILKNMNKYLASNDFRLIHSDIHFDNIIMKEDKSLKLIDFETSMYAPIDYELDIFLRMCRNPLKYASEEEEKLIDINDYKMIEPYFRKLYPEIFEIHDFEIRNKIYDLESNLRLLPRFPENIELKDIVIKDLNDLKKYMNESKL